MNWFLDNPRVKKWVKTLLEHQEALESAAEGRLGKVLGCGHWGCVVDMPETPWVLKLTVDPTEAHIWSKIVNLIEEERYGGDGFPRVKKLFELRPGIPYGKMGRTKRAYGIVREKVAPAFDSSSGLLFVAPYTLTKLGVETDKSSLVTFSDLPKLWSGYEIEAFISNVEALSRYRTEVHMLYKGDGFLDREERIERIERTLYQMGGAVGGALGESLGMLASNGLFLNDVHMGNIGWRIFPEIDGPGEYAHEGLVIFDPGHTPTQKRPLPKEQWKQLAALG